MIVTGLIVLIIIVLCLTYKKWFLPLWLGYEHIFQKLFHLKTIDEENPFFHYRVRPFKGRPIQMTNGDQLRKGDLVFELHFDNDRLYQLGSESQSYVQLAIKLIRLAQKQLPLVDDLLKQPEFKEVKAVYGISMINRGVKQMGFQVVDMTKGLMYYFTLMYLRFLVGVIHPSGRERLKLNPEDLVPKIMIRPASETFTINKSAREKKKKTSTSVSPI
ncbi:hypothetical protein PU629_15165 [Pullulanibacillus sp. KACC 23026]|uniref:YkoP family protein n=1 Tax=Pullulanibacillus sp. KACC 23026 TaxID=3028315 RepID=UPI0023B01287|nr:hypothetical protein [Pullulanibacillus sp. KACC 23026]WEG11487.1 hypothetical protein PU629_15165 [Pullulanibacillus sp. KACC 23026]